MPSRPAPAPSPAASAEPSWIPTFGGAYFALGTLFSMNLLNYVDRYVFNILGVLIRKDIKMSDGSFMNDAGFAWLAASFMIVYTIISPFVGYVGDRYSRRVLIGAGVGLWSLATVGTAFSTDYWHLFFWRAVLGVGEASYGIIAPTLLADLFTPKQRGRVMGLFYLALPVGGAVGYSIGGWVGHHYGWRAAFWVVGLPGIVAAIAGVLIHDPGRGASEGKVQSDPRSKTKKQGHGWAAYLDLFKNRTFLLNTAGLAAVTFSTGALAVFGPTFYQRVHKMSTEEAGKSIAVLVGFAGLLGIGLGIVATDWLNKQTRRANLLWAAGAVFVALPFGVGALLTSDKYVSMALLFVAMLLLSAVLAPCNTVTANVVPAAKRAAGYAASIFLLHLFGDISSPPIVGKLSDWFGKPSVAASSTGRMLASLGAVPVPGLDGEGPTNLAAGLLAMAPTLLIGGIFFLLGAKFLPDDTDRAQAEGGDDGGGAMPH